MNDGKRQFTSIYGNVMQFGQTNAQSVPQSDADLISPSMHYKSFQIQIAVIIVMISMMLLPC